jgi:hypothetical protein
VCLQETYSTTAINYDFALITLQADASPGLGYFGIERGTGSDTYNIASAGYPADKTSGSLWMTTCNNVEYDYGQNQGVFKDVSQCTNNVSVPLVPHELSRQVFSFKKAPEIYVNLSRVCVLFKLMMA